MSPRTKKIQRTYTGDVVRALAEFWRICGCICGKRLQPFIPEMVNVLERHNEIVLDVETRNLLLQMSASTIDRRLTPFRQQRRRGLSTTKPGTLLKDAIPIRTFADWNEAKPGFVEMELVAHCGETAALLQLCRCRSARQTPIARPPSLPVA